MTAGCWRHDYEHREYVCTCVPERAYDTGREASLTTHVRQRESDQFDYRLTDPRFRCTCSCGWQAPGWFDNDQSAFVVWSQHVREANEGEAS